MSFPPTNPFYRRGRFSTTAESRIEYISFCKPINCELVFFSIRNFFKRKIPSTEGLRTHLVHKFSCTRYNSFASLVKHTYSLKLPHLKLLLLLLLLLSLLSQSLLVFFLCISRAQTMHLERQSLKSIILFIH